jgi:hypothetical protein
MSTLVHDDLIDWLLTSSWNETNRKIDTQGFPPGRMVGRRRIWTEREVLAWLEARPSDRVPPRGAAKINRDKKLLDSKATVVLTAKGKKTATRCRKAVRP